MAKSKYHVGLEIGTSTTRVVVAEVKPDFSARILGLGQSRSAGVRKGEIHDLNHARASIKATLLEAEDLSDVKIGSVFLAVSGGHIRGMNNRGTYRLPDENTEVTDSHIMEVEDIASDTNIPSDHAYIHTLARHYRLDGQESRTPPIGFYGKTLDADFHLVHGVKSRIQNTLKVARECSIEIEDIVFSPIASAQVALNRERKEAGALVIDMGGGTTDYALYIQGAIYASGCIPIGGDHITNDIHLVSHIPLSMAEAVKVQHGDVSGSEDSMNGIITLEDEVGLNHSVVERKILNKVISHRLKEILTLLQERLPEGIIKFIGTGIYLCGGVGKTKGISTVVNEIFPLPIYRPDQSEISGSTALVKDPQLFTAIGLIHYAQILEQDDAASVDGPLGFISKIFSK